MAACGLASAHGPAAAWHAGHPATWCRSAAAAAEGAPASEPPASAPAEGPAARQMPALLPGLAASRQAGGPVHGGAVPEAQAWGLLGPAAAARLPPSGPAMSSESESSESGSSETGSTAESSPAQRSAGWRLEGPAFNQKKPLNSKALRGFNLM